MANIRFTLNVHIMNTGEGGVYVNYKHFEQFELRSEKTAGRSHHQFKSPSTLLTHSSQHSKYMIFALVVVVVFCVLLLMLLM